jgi:DNA-binding XRE family transcriptional regulator
MSGAPVGVVEVVTSLRGTTGAHAAGVRKAESAKTDLDPLVAALVSARERRDLSQAEVARRAGWSKQQQQKIESGKVKSPSAAVCRRFAQAMGLEIALVEGADDER